MTTRTVIAVIDNASYTDDGATPADIVNATITAAELYYANRDDVAEFDVIERLEAYAGVQLPADYNADENREIAELAWKIYCGDVVMKEFKFRTDADSGTITAPDFDNAVKQLNDMFTEAMLEDGAWGWVQDTDGYRHNIGERC